MKKMRKKALRKAVFDELPPVSDELKGAENKF
jgi:hypothetical protein